MEGNNSVEYNQKKLESLGQEKDQPGVAKTLYSLGLSFEKAGDDVKALEYYLKSYEMRIRLFGDIDDPNLALSLHQIGHVYERLGNQGKASAFKLKACLRV